jgi:ribosomal protein L27
MEEDSPWTTPSTNIGTGIDELIRDIIEGAIYYDTTDNQYKTVKGNKHLDEVYPNASRD